MLKLIFFQNDVGLVYVATSVNGLKLLFFQNVGFVYVATSVNGLKLLFFQNVGFVYVAICRHEIVNVRSGFLIPKHEDFQRCRIHVATSLNGLKIKKNSKCWYCLCGHM